MAKTTKQRRKEVLIEYLMFTFIALFILDVIKYLLLFV